MLAPNALLTFTGFLALAASVVTYRRTHSLSFELRTLCSIAAAFACILVFVFVAFVLAGPAHDWGAIRLAQSEALLNGYDLYYPEKSGPLLSTIYGPIAVLWFLPAAMVEDITRSFYAAGVLKFTSLLIPLLVLFLRASDGRYGLAIAFYFLTLGALAADTAMVQVLGTIHVDAPAVGLALLSCACLLGSRPRPSRTQMILAATTAALSAWTKQVDVTLFLAQSLWLWIAHGRRFAVRYFMWCAICGAIVTVVVMASFGFGVTFFNVVSVPGRHDFYPFAPIFREYARLSLPFLLAGAWVLIRTPGRGRLPLAEPWGLIAIAAVFLFPTSLLARAKLGGFLNSLHSQFFLITAVGLGVFSIVASARATKVDRLVAIALALVPLPFLPYQRSLNIYGREGMENRQEKALAFCLAHRGEAFFPWNPLITLISDGHLYHFEWAVRDRAIAGFTPTDEHIRAHLPENLIYVVYPEGQLNSPGVVGRELLGRLPEFSKRVELPELPEYAVFMRE